ncbi:MAG: VTT domain-containing protein, partial [Planctomycetota bacterium]
MGQPDPGGALGPALGLDGDGISIRRWFAFYSLLVLAAGVPLALRIGEQGWSWDAWIDRTTATFAATDAGVKLLGFALYLSVCCTFLPLPTGWIVAGVATRQAAVTGELWTTVLVVAVVGGLASTVANLNDYHLMTWILRSRRVARVRDTRAYRVAARWFARAPFSILVVFNVLPIPVDVIRMLAATSRYPRAPFAAANFIGRSLRYGVIAFVTFWWNLGGIAVLALL